MVESAAAVVLPGVGAAGATMARLEAAGLVDPIGRAARDGRPFLGVCLGLQLLFDHLDEDDVPGLGVLPGRVRRLPGGLKVPHMGWNTVRPTPAAWPALAGDGAAPAHYYFVHSYYADPAGAATALVAGTTCYGVEFCSALRQERLWATQFHPEKSGPAGLALLAAFVAEVPG